MAAAKALQKVGVYWLEEPFARDDFEGPARLCREMDPLMITGGEGWKGLDPFREGLVHDTYDIFQPDLNTCGGLLTIRKIAALCEAFHKPCIGHGAFGLNMVGGSRRTPHGERHLKKWRWRHRPFFLRSNGHPR